jgi:hypothetical protein
VPSKIPSRHGGGPAALNGLNLGQRPGQLGELAGQLRAVKVLATSGLDGTQRGARHATDAADGATVERAVLLRLLAVFGESSGEGMRRRGWVGFRRVVGTWRGAALLAGRRVSG